MGAWGHGSFDNDDACDWLYELETASDISVLQRALQIVVDSNDDYLEAPACSNAIAAAEVIAALQGQPTEHLPENAILWIEAHRDLDVSSLLLPAQLALQRIRLNSELQELWDESDDPADWYATLDDLSARLHKR